MMQKKFHEQYDDECIGMYRHHRKLCIGSHKDLLNSRVVDRYGIGYYESDVK